MTTKKQPNVAAEATIVLTADEQSHVNALIALINELEALGLQVLEKEIAAGQKFMYIKEYIWDARVSALAKEQGKDWKTWIAEVLQKDYSRLTRCVKSAKYHAENPSLVEQFKSDGKHLGYAANSEDFNNWVEGKPSKNSNRGKNPPADLIRWSGVEIKVKKAKDSSKATLVKGTFEDIDKLIGELRGFQADLQPKPKTEDELRAELRAEILAELEAKKPRARAKK